MKYMRNLIIIFLILGSIQGMAQKEDTIKIESKTYDDEVGFTDKSSFPEKCLGVWQGTMYMYNQGTLRDSVRVRFTAARTDTPGTFTWKTEYLSADRPMIKDYKLVVDDLSKGRYILDEGDGVKLMEYNLNNKLYSMFKVNDIYLTSSTELLNDELIFEVTSGKEVDEMQGVKNYSFTNVQRVVMHKID